MVWRTSPRLEEDAEKGKVTEMTREKSAGCVITLPSARSKRWYHRDKSSNGRYGQRILYLVCKLKGLVVF